MAETARQLTWRNPRSKVRDRAFLQKMEELLERRLPYLGGRAARVESLADNVGRLGGLGEDQRALLSVGARYQDLGLLGIPEGLLEARRKLSEEERHAVDDHIRLGGQVLNLAYFDYPEVLEIVWYHHERPDGQGPLRLRGEEIPFLARIASISAALESMHSGRPHRAAMSPEQIREELHRCEGSQFDANLVRLVSGRHAELLASMSVPPTDQAPARPPPAGSAQSTPAQARLAPPGPRQNQPAKGAASASPPASAKRVSAPAVSHAVGVVDRVNIAEELDRIQQLRALPTTVCEVLTMAGDKDADHRALARIIRQDVALTSRILAVANASAYRAKKTKITSIEESVVSLGFETIKKLATGIGILRSLESAPNGACSYMKLWEHSFACAELARLLCSERDEGPACDPYLVGMLHDLGKFVLAEFFPEHLGGLVSAESPESEAKMVGLDHARLGGKLLLKWSIPIEMSGPIGRHHASWRDLIKSTPQEIEPVVNIQLADGLAVALGFDSGFLDYLPDIPRKALEGCRGIKKLKPDKLRSDLGEQMREMKTLLGLFDGPQAPMPETTTAESSPRPHLTYVTAAPSLPVDLLALWFEYSGGYELRSCPLESCEVDADNQAYQVINPGDAEATQSRGDRLNQIMQRRRGVVITQGTWQKCLAGASESGWQIVQPPLAIRSLEMALRRASAEQ